MHKLKQMGKGFSSGTSYKSLLFQMEYFLVIFEQWMLLVILGIIKQQVLNNLVLGEHLIFTTKNSPTTK